MAKIYENSSFVLVPGRYLHTSKSEHASKLELRFRIYCCRGMQRLWELQEGVLGPDDDDDDVIIHRLWFVFEDKILDLSWVHSRATTSSHRMNLSVLECQHALTAFHEGRKMHWELMPSISPLTVLHNTLKNCCI